MAHHGGIFCNGFPKDWSEKQVYTRAERPRRARLQEPHHRRLGVRAGDAHRRGARREPPQLLRGLPRAQARHRRVLAVAHAGLVEGEDAAALGRELGRAGPAPARQFRGLRPRRLEAEVARGARPRALDAFLHRLRRRAAEAVLRPLPQGRGHRLGRAAAGAAAGAPPGEQFVERHEKEWPLARTQWTKLLPRSRPTVTLSTKRAGETAAGHLRGPRRRRHLPHPAARSRRPRSPARSRPSSSSRPRPPTPTCSWWCGCSRPT